MASIVQTRSGVTIKFQDRVRVLELLGRHLGMFKDRVEHVTLMGLIGPDALSRLSDEALEEAISLIERLQAIIGPTETTRDQAAALKAARAISKAQTLPPAPTTPVVLEIPATSDEDAV